MCVSSGIMRKSSVSGSSSGSQERAGKGVTFAPEHSCMVSSQRPPDLSSVYSMFISVLACENDAARVRNSSAEFKMNCAFN